MIRISSPMKPVVKHSLSHKRSHHMAGAAWGVCEKSTGSRTNWKRLWYNSLSDVRGRMRLIQL